MINGGYLPFRRARHFVVGATWDNANQSGGISLDSTNLIATRVSGVGNQIIYGTLGKTAGKWWVEYLVTVTGSFLYTGFGFGGHLAETDASYRDSGTIFVNGISKGAFSTFATNDVINAALDIDGLTVTFYKNNVQQGLSYAIPSSKTWYAMTALGVNNSICQARKQSAMTNAPPAGYSSYFG